MHGAVPRPRGSWRWTALAIVPALLLLAWQTSCVWPFFSDDAFISLRYSERLLAGDGLTWTEGERVEGYSNLAWVVLCAGLGALGIELVTAARWLGAVATAVGLWALARAFAPRDVRTAARAAAAPLLAASTQVALGWTLAGLEGPLVFACVALASASLLRSFAAEPAIAAWPRAWLLRASAPLAVLCWTRPDAPLWVASIAAALAIAALRAGPPTMARVGATFAALPFAAFLVQLGFRLAYHGDWVPNTAHVKAEFAASAWPAGLRYVVAALDAHKGLAIPAAAFGSALLLRRATRGQALVLLLPVLVWLAYLVAIGGDHFPCRRLLHGAIAPLALLAVHGASALAARRRLRPLLLLCLAGGIVWNVALARTDAQSEELRNEVWEWRGKAIGEGLRAAFADRAPLLAVDAAGAIPFYSKLPALDLLGLCDRTIATTPYPEWFATVREGTPWPPGHLRGNGRYVMDRAPDLFLFGPPPGSGPLFVSGVELEEDPRFLDGYRLVAFDFGERAILAGRVERVVAYLWVRVDGKAGVQRSDDGRRVVIPGWLFGSFAMRTPLMRRYQPEPADPAARAAIAAQAEALVRWHAAPPAAAVPDAHGTLRGRLAERTTRLTLPLDPGTWRAQVEPPAEGRTVRVAGNPVATDGTIVLATGGRHEVELLCADAERLPVTIDRVVLVRER